MAEANHRYARPFAVRALPGAPARATLVLARLDARLDPLAELGLGIGDAQVVHNGGGRTREALRSIVLSSERFATSRSLVIHHPSAACDGVGASVRDAVAALRATRLAPSAVGIGGFVDEVATDILHPVAPPCPGGSTGVDP